MRGQTRVYVGNLPEDIRQSEIEDLFGKYGRIRSVDLKAVRPPIYAFVEFSDDRDADEAVYKLDGRRYFGATLRVEFSRDRRMDDRRGGGMDRARSGREPGPPRKGPNSTGYRLRVEGLPPSASWQDLKDHVRKFMSVKPAFAQVYDDRGISVGIVEFDTRADLDEAYDKLHKTDFENRFDKTVITVEIDDDTGRGGGRDRSRSRSRSRGRSKSPRRSRSRSKSPRRSRSRSRSKSRSPSRSRSPARSKSPMKEDA